MKLLMTELQMKRSDSNNIVSIINVIKEGRLKARTANGGRNGRHVRRVKCGVEIRVDEAPERQLSE